MTDKNDDVLSQLRVSVSRRGLHLVAKVAELLAADEEYDAAFLAEHPKHSIIARRTAARERRAAAIRAMRGDV